MTENHPADEAINEQKKVQAGLYRIRDVVNGLLALAEDGSIGAGQVLAAMKKAVVRHLG